MTEKRFLRIGEVVNRTGLSERMIRHYERLGLIRPHRSTSGQRLFDAAALADLAKVQILKQAGFKLNDIGQLLSKSADARTLVSAQLDLLKKELERLNASVRLLEIVEKELSDGGEANVEQLGRILDAGRTKQSREGACAFFERHFTPTQHADWRKMQQDLRVAVDPAAYDRAWKKLAEDIKIALPLDPASLKAQAFLARWDKLVEPFRKVASPDQQEMAKTMWSNVDKWSDSASQPVTGEIVEFIKAARAAAIT